MKCKIKEINSNAFLDTVCDCEWSLFSTCRGQTNLSVVRLISNFSIFCPFVRSSDTSDPIVEIFVGNFIANLFIY